VEAKNIFPMKQKNVLQKSKQYLKEFNDEFVSIEHMLIALLEIKSTASNLLKDNNVNKKI